MGPRWAPATRLASQVSNETSTANALNAITFGLGDAVLGQINSSGSGASAVHGTDERHRTRREGRNHQLGQRRYAISGTTNGTGPAIVGQITNAANTSVAVVGVTNGTGAAFGGLAVGAGPAVQATVWGTGPAVVASIVIPSNSQPAVAASTSGTGPAIQGTATGTGSRGGVFAGVAAQIRLTPGAGSKHPGSGNVGDLYVDSTARLWFCKVGGSLASWSQIA